MTNIARYLQHNTANKRPNVVQIRISDTDKNRLEQLAQKYGVTVSRLVYELFRFSIDLYDLNNPNNKDINNEAK